MAMDDSFKKPGAIPFQWEIRPGVPKLQQSDPRSTSPSHHLCHSLLHHQQKPNYHRRSSRPLLKLRPPPAGFSFPTPELEPRVRSSQFSPRTRTGHHWVDPAFMARPDIVESGCFASSLLKHKDDKKRNIRSKPKSETDPDYESDLETLSRSSESTRKSISPFSDSPFLSPCSSYQSSPCLFSDPEWVGFGLF